MGRAVFEEERSFLDSNLPAAAVVCHTGTNLHSGLLYRSGGSAAILHLGWQDVLSQNWAWRRLWAAPDVEPERLASLALLCGLIWASFVKDRRFPYCLKFHGTHFDLQTGALVFGPGSKGLTCATFVLAVFHSMGLRLVDEASWPPRPDEDREFLKMVASFASPTHLKVLTEEVESGCKRIRPDEMLGACACPLPAAFECARSEGDRVLERLMPPAA